MKDYYEIKPDLLKEVLNPRVLMTPSTVSFSTVNSITYNDLINISEDMEMAFCIINMIRMLYAPLENPIFTGNVTVPAGVNPTDAVNLQQLEAAINTDKLQDMVRVATTDQITLSNTQVVDGVVLLSGDRVLVKDQDNDVDNGVYIVSEGTWEYAKEFITGVNVDGFLYSVNEGSANKDKFFKVRSSGTDLPITVGIENIFFDEISSITIAQINNIISPIIESIANLSGSNLMNYISESGSLEVYQLLNTAILISPATFTLPSVNINYVYVLSNDSTSIANATYVFPVGTTYMSASGRTALSSISIAPGAGIKVAFNATRKQYNDTI